MVPTTTTLEGVATLEDAQIDVALGAALIAKDSYGDLDAGALVARIDALASPLDRWSWARTSPTEQAVALSLHVRENLGFRGNDSDYHDPRNSLLPDVLERRLGIPITLALVYLRIAGRAGIHATGVAFPGHFLVRVDASETPAAAPDALLDPFSGGLLDQDAAEALLRRALGPAATLDRAHVAPASPRAVLVRILTNLDAAHRRQGEWARAHLAVDRILTLVPRSPTHLRERAELSLRLGALEAARSDLEQVLTLEPEGANADAARRILDDLGKTASVLH